MCLCSHMEAFAHALQLDETYFDLHGDTSSPQIPGSPIGSAYHPRIQKVSALSDFAPINLKVKRYVPFFAHIKHQWLHRDLLGAVGRRNIMTNEVTISFFFYVGHY